MKIVVHALHLQFHLGIFRSFYNNDGIRLSDIYKNRHLFLISAHG